ncbi:hypothetical protein MPLDJ20_260062 [Mesorhizobium plurifarium]|uniref:DUF1403 family protein n=1 Tax=Mesorhizobium plurifarium TaxID=69974 RepID=A0A090FDE6_MESPL|nr:hypothetical protein MPLDJ20_260062 [Mesorhizobium plurifarium]
MIRLDPVTANPAAPPTVPAWALTADCAMHDADAAFRAGAALGALDGLARAQASWAGAWRKRLALKCPADSMRLAGRAEDEAGLRDAWQLCPAGADPGPAGTIFGAWRKLALQPPAVSADRLAKGAELLGLAWDEEALADLCTQIEDVAGSQRPVPVAAAAIAAHSPCAPTPTSWLVARRPGAGARPALAAAAAAVDGPGFWSGLPCRGRRQAHPTRRKRFRAGGLRCAASCSGGCLPAGQRAVAPRRKTAGGGAKAARQRRRRRDCFAAE